MRYVKTLGLVAVATMALTAFYGTTPAPATVLCKTQPISNVCPNGEHYNPGSTVIDGSLKGTAVLETLTGTLLDTCTQGTLKSEVSNTGAAGIEVAGSLEALNWGTAGAPCTKTTDTIVNGILWIRWNEGSNNGRLEVTGTKVTVNTIFGSCVYGIGTGTITGGAIAEVDIGGTVKKIEGPATCPGETRWTANYEVTEPKPLYITNE